jgi:hypothetical protein
MADVVELEVQDELTKMRASCARALRGGTCRHGCGRRQHLDCLDVAEQGPQGRGGVGAVLVGGVMIGDGRGLLRAPETDVVDDDGCSARRERPEMQNEREWRRREEEGGE